MSKSSEIVLNWLNNEIKLNPKITDIKKSFSNGYHLAEIFYILKLITPEEFCKFTNTEKYADKKLNFLRIEKICQKLFNLIIPEEDINMIINKDYTKAVVLLYKIRNCIYKNNIHFNDIEIFGSAFSGDEISNQIKEIIKRQFYSEEEEENESEEKSKESNPINNSESIYGDGDSLNLKKTKYEEEKNIFNKNNTFKYTLDDKIKEEIEENENMYNKNINNTLNKNMVRKKNLPSIKIKKNEIKNDNFNDNEQINYIKNILLLKPKNILAPINNRLLKTKSNSCENIFSKENKNNDNNIKIFRNTNQSDYFNGTFSTKSFYTKLININHFNKQLDYLGVLSNEYKLDEDVNPSEIGNSKTINIYKNKNNKNIDNKNDSLYDTMYKTKTIDEVRNELKNKLKFKKIENKMKQKELKRELSQKNIDDNKTEINFLKMNKNKFFEKNKSMSLLFKDYSNKSLLRRLDYSKELAKKIDKENMEKKNINLSKFYQSQTDFRPTLFSNQKLNSSRNEQKKEETSFNSKKFFEKLNKINYLSNLSYTNQKHKIKNAHFKLIKDIVLFIIDMAMEGYFYQNQNKKELLDLKTFLKFNIYFLKNKPLRKKLIIIEDNEYKRSSKLDDNDIDIEKLVSSLTNEEKYLIQDYIYYLGVWDDERIYDKKLRGLKLEFKYVNYTNNNANSFNNSYFGLNEYEPTVLENEDLLLPKINVNNTLIGNTIIDILDHKFTASNKNTNNNEIKLALIENSSKNINVNLNKLNDNNSKWDYIPYKIALVGYPLSGRKTVAEKINIKYPNIKIYSISQIIKDYYELFLKYSDPPENPPKNKNSKKKKKKNDKINEKEKNKNKSKETFFEKQERHKKLRELQPIINLIQPYIDYQQNINNNTNSINNSSKMDNSNNNNTNNNEIFIMQDENICKLLIKKIEEDFPFIDQEKIDKNSIDLQKKIHDMLDQIENIKKRKLEAKKPNPKDDAIIEKLEKEIKSLKEKSISGFILVDFPINIKQCYLLENYLTGFIDDKRRQKSEQNKIIENISSIIDFKIEPKEKKLNKKSGLNFLIHISAKENIINERFNSIKYDPVEEKVYPSSDIITDKKILERLVDENPSLPKELFEYYKEEYNNNINKIINLYSNFGFSLNSKTDENDAILPIKSNNKNDNIIKTYQYMEAEEIRQFIPTEGRNKKTKKRAAKKSPKKVNKSKEKEKSIDTDKNGVTTTNSNLNESQNKDKVYNFICGNIIEKLFLEKEKNEKELFYKAYPKYKKNDTNQVNFAPDLNINEIRSKYKIKSPKKQINKDIKLIDYDINKINIMLSQLTLINTKYKKHLAKFIHLTTEQKKNIYTRLNLVQTKFRNYLNKKSNKKKIISNYIKKYNKLFNLDPNLLTNERVIEELLSDIEDLRTEIWKIINKKQNLSIEELKEIKNCGYIESQLLKFYFNIKDLFLIETEKFIIILSNTIMLYNKKKERSKDKDDNFNELMSEFESEMRNKMEFILKNTKQINYYLNQKKEAKFDQTLDEIADIILDNIEIIFKNTIKLLFSFNDSIDNILKRIKKIIYNNSLADKKTFKSRKGKRKSSEKKIYSISMVNDLLENKDIGYHEEERIKKMFLDEKNKYKFRICYIKSFAIKYIHIIKCTTENIFNNMDEWIVKNVTLQNESLSFLIKTLKQFLNDKASIDQQNDIDYIELDEFEKVIDDEEINNNNNNSSNIKVLNNTSNISNLNGSSHELKLKPFDNSSVLNMNRIYNKINLDYLINENFVDTKIKEFINKTSKNKKKSTIQIMPTPSSIPYPESNIPKNSSSNDDINSSSGVIKKQYMFAILNDSDFYFDIEKFKYIYKMTKKYEIEDGLLNKEIFFQIFIKQFLFSKKDNLNQNKPKEDEDNEPEKYNLNINSFYNEEIIMDLKFNNSNNFPGICKALKNLRSKQIQRLLSIFVSNIDKLNYISFENEIKDKDNNIISEESEQNKEKDKKEKEKDDIKRKDKKKTTNRTSKNKKTEDFKQKSSKKDIEILYKDKNKKTEKNQLEEINEEKNVDEKNKKEENDKDKEKNKEKEKEKEKNNVEYDTYLSTKEIFTILSLIGVNVLTNEMEEKIENDLKDKYILNKYLQKNDFLEYKFWFETFFEYLNEKNENESANKVIPNIKEFLFDIWKNDDNSTYFDFKKFIEVLKINKYVTDYVDFNDVRYYDIIFEQ